MNFFSIETNNQFNSKLIYKKKEIELLKSVLSNLKIKKERKFKLFIINKKNKITNLFESKSNNLNIMISSLDLKKKIVTIKKNEKKIYYFNNLQLDFLPKFILNQNNKYFIKKKSKYYLAYKKISGKVYDGNPKFFFPILKLAIKLNNILKQFNIKNKKKLFNKDKIKIKKIISYKTKICSAKLNNFLLKRKIISKKTFMLIINSKKFIYNIFKSFENLSGAYINKLDLVHNDLNHSNILINQKKIFFIDLDSIIYANKKISYGHLLFKVIRHHIYKKKTIPKINYILSYLIRKKIFSSINELLLFIQLRIISDIVKILDSKKNNLFYDYEKKIHNLFEANLIFNKYVK